MQWYGRGMGPRVSADAVRFVPVLCPVCGAYWKCNHRMTDEAKDAAATPRSQVAPESASVPAATKPSRGIITIDGVLLEDA